MQEPRTGHVRGQTWPASPLPPSSPYHFSEIPGHFHQETQSHPFQPIRYLDAEGKVATQQLHDASLTQWQTLISRSGENKVIRHTCFLSRNRRMPPRFEGRFRPRDAYDVDVVPKDLSRICFLPMGTNEIAVRWTARPHWAGSASYIGLTPPQSSASGFSYRFKPLGSHIR
jgi:hypothetical protein